MLTALHHRCVAHGRATRIIAFLTLAFGLVLAGSLAVWTAVGRGAVPIGYSVDVGATGTTTSGNLGGSGSLQASGSHGSAAECAPSSGGGPFSYTAPPQDCQQLGRAYLARAPRFLYTGNANCVKEGRPLSGATFTWHVRLPETGYWRVQAYVPSWTAYGWGNQYILTAAAGTFQHDKLTQQSYHGRWVQVFGPELYSSGQDATVKLTPADSADAYCHYQSADQMKWTFVAPSAPRNTGVPSISGQAVAGQVLTAAGGSWTNNPTSYRYQWEDCNSSGTGCGAIAGATSQSYKLTGSDVGHRVTITETAGNAGGTSAPATSAPTSVVAAATLPPSQRCPAVRKPPRRRRGVERVFSAGNDEIAIAPGQKLPFAYYHFQLPSSKPLGRASPWRLASFTIDSGARRVFLSFSATGRSEVILTGTFCTTRLKSLKRGRAFSLHVVVPLRNLISGAPAGTLNFNAQGKLVRPRKKARRHSAIAAARKRKPRSSALKLSGGLSLDPGVLGPRRQRGEVKAVKTKFPAAPQPQRPIQPISSAYAAFSPNCARVSCEHGKLPMQIYLQPGYGFVSVVVSTPLFLCDDPFYSDSFENQWTSVNGAVDADGVFSASGVGEESYADGTPAGYYVFSMAGRFLAPKDNSQGVVGVFHVTAYATSGVATGVSCSYGSSFGGAG